MSSFGWQTPANPNWSFNDSIRMFRRVRDEYTDIAKLSNYNEETMKNILYTEIPNLGEEYRLLFFGELSEDTFSHIDDLNGLILSSLMRDVIRQSRNQEIYSKMAKGILDQVSINILSYGDVYKFYYAWTQRLIDVPLSVAKDTILEKQGRFLEDVRNNNINDRYNRPPVPEMRSPSLMESLNGDILPPRLTPSGVYYTNRTADSRIARQPVLPRSSLKYQLLHPDYSTAINKQIPQRALEEGDVISLEPLGEFVYSCSNPRVPHYFNVDSYTNYCQVDSTGRDCTQCPVCRQPMMPQVYRDISYLSEGFSSPELSSQPPPLRSPARRLQLSPRRQFNYDDYEEY